MIIKNSFRQLFKTIFFVICMMFFSTAVFCYHADASDKLGVPDGELSEYAVYDAEGLIEDNYKDEINAKMKEIYDEYGVHTYVIISTKIGMSDDYEGYLEDMHKKLPSLDAVALLIGFKENDHVYILRSYGHGNITDSVLKTRRLKEIQNDMKADMKAHDFFKASQLYLDEVSDSLSTYDPNFDYERAEMFEGTIFKWYVTLIICIVICSIIFGIMAGSSGMKVTTSAKTYLDSDNSRVISGFSRFTHKTVTRTKRSSDSSGSGGGGGGSSSGGSSF